MTAFFCTSGFLITANILRRYDRVANVNLRAFYVMRVGRIAPPLVLLCVLLSLLSKTSLQPFVFPASLSLKKSLLSIIALRYNLYYQRGSQLLPWAVLWSLSIEEMFYLGYPVIAKVTRSTQWLVAILVGIIAYALVHRLGGVSTIYDYFGCFDAIAIGALSALTAKYFSRNITGSAAWAFVVTGSAIAIYTYWKVKVTDKYNVSLTLIALGTGLVLFASQCAPFVHKKLWSYDPLAYCGRLSYEIYLFHMTIFSLLSFVFAPLPTQHRMPIFAVTFLCIVATSDLIRRFYSEPLNRWLRTKLLPVRLPRVVATEALARSLPIKHPLV